MAEISSANPKQYNVGLNSARCQSLSISLDDDNTTVQWDLQVEVRRGEGGWATIAVFRSNAVGNGPRNRLLGICYCPGAIEWAVTPTVVRSTIPANRVVNATMDLATTDCCGADPAAATLFASLRLP